MSNKVKIYLYAFLLMLFVFSLTLHIINGLKFGEFEYFRILISVVATAYALYNIITLSKIENNK